MMTRQRTTISRRCRQGNAALEIANQPKRSYDRVAKVDDMLQHSQVEGWCAKKRDATAEEERERSQDLRTNELLENSFSPTMYLPLAFIESACLTLWQIYCKPPCLLNRNVLLPFNYRLETQTYAYLMFQNSQDRLLFKGNDLRILFFY